MTYREAARIAKCSTGAISAEVKAMKTEAIAREKKKALEEALLPTLELETSPETNVAMSENRYQGHEFEFENHEQAIDLKL
jgi:hypothetical protein